MKLIKASLILTMAFYVLLHYNIIKGVPSIIFPENFPSVITETITTKLPKITADTRPEQLTTEELMKLIQNNQLQQIQIIWQQLGIKSELFKKGIPLLVESFPLSLADRPGSVYVFLIKNDETNDWQYLVFNIQDRTWKFYGHIDLPNQELTEPMARQVTIEDRTWLVITSQANSAELPGMYQEHWYDLSGSKLKEALQYYVYQDQALPGFTKRYTAVIQETGSSGGTYFINLHTELAYLNDLTSQPEFDGVFSLSCQVWYLWDQSSQRFKNHQPQSDQLYNYQADQILAHNYLRIEDLAKRKGNSQGKLIRCFLNLCSDNSEKRQILKMLR